ncbi:unnamed protein product [Rotaria sp. Silwood2]|nr:unnamed protein product [Rotaria sp. Silwood2]CAF2572376.1 unnamed protein product [Rotaria sp. Silwood2]CAF2733029.1 unnamed protein product [Rotaria sp. Silwood2]CAF2900102.1 unnamed protein product [Rotaria sp. Silwood2]CAF4029483.1 unnamed protein product [Rotaria sp. Silwood2]
MSTSLAQAQQAMSLYGLSTFYILGTIGNFLLISILVQRTHRQNSCSLYLLSATFVNFILIQCILPLAIYSGDHEDPQNKLLIWCKIRSYLFNALLMLYRWFKMAACIDRAAMCSRRAWIRSFSNVSFAYRTISIITIVWLLIPIHLAVYFRIEAGHCVPQSGVYSKIFSAYSIIISGWSPPIVMAIFGLIAYKNLKKVRARVTPSNFSGGNNGDYSSNSIRRTINTRLFSKRDQQLLLLLICEVFLYIFTNLLYSINITYSAITSNYLKDIERIRIESFISYFSTPFLIIINNCATFYLYLIVSSKFRQDVKKFLTSCCHLHQVAPAQINPAIIINRATTTNHQL